MKSIFGFLHQPNKALVFWGAVIAAVSFVILTANTNLLSWDLEIIFNIAALCVLVPVLILGILHDHLSVLIYGLSVTFDGDSAEESVVAEFPEQVRLWRWDPRISGLNILSYYEKENRFSFKVQPITPNPKVRQLHVNITFVSAGTLQLYRLYRRFCRSLWPKHQSFDAWVQYQLYEFKNARSKDLGELYNPLEPTQQDRLTAMLKSFFEPMLENSGVILAEASFSVD